MVHLRLTDEEAQKLREMISASPDMATVVEKLADALEPFVLDDEVDFGQELFNGEDVQFV